MSFAHKTRVAVLRGGPSSEYEVSLRTGEAVLRSLPQKYEAIDVFIDREGVWHVHGIARKPADALKHVDVAYVALHGSYGECGQVQRILEQLRVPYAGSTTFSSALASSGHLAKGALSKLSHLKDKVKLAWHKMFTKDEVEAMGLHEVFRLIPHPSIVKPVGGSSSMTVVRAFHDLEVALEEAFSRADSVMIEEHIDGKEAVVTVIEGFRGQHHYALLPVEIDWSAGGEHHVPARFGDVIKETLQDAAAAIHRELGLRHYSGHNFVVHPRRGIYLVGSTVSPYLGKDAVTPKSLTAVGSGLPEFLDHVISAARER